MNISFKAANININVVSDTHGNIDKCAKFVGVFNEKSKEITAKPQRGNANVFAVCGDWFMSGGTKGYKSSPETPIGYFQLISFNKLCHRLKSTVHGLKTVFIPGNHEFDGGDKLLGDIFNRMDSEIVDTNLDFENSKAFQKVIDSGKLLKTKTIEVEDDKKDGVKHKVLLLGISPVNLSYYSKNIPNTSFIDNKDIPQKQVTEKDYEATTLACLDEINKFKSENPNGAVILFSHTGVNFAQNLIKRNAPVDFVFDGHEHKNTTDEETGVPVLSLSKDFDYFANLKLHFDDNGKLEKPEFKKIPIEGTSTEPDEEMESFYNRLLAADLKPEYIIRSKIEGLLAEHHIRRGPSALANYITDSILTELHKTNPEVEIFALNASAMRNPLPVGYKHPISNMQVLNVLKGITDSEADLVSTDVSGETLIDMLLDNYLTNRIAQEKNPIIHYSGLMVDRQALLKDYDEGKSYEELRKHIKTQKDKQIIDLNKSYKIANVIKYYNKMQNQKIKALKDISTPLNQNAKKLFIQHFEQTKNNYFEYESRLN